VFRYRPQPCTNCGKVLDAGSRPGDEEYTPEHSKQQGHGAAMICLACGHVMILEDGTLRDLTDKEIIELAGDRDLVMIQNAILAAKRAADNDGD